MAILDIKIHKMSKDFLILFIFCSVDLLFESDLIDTLLSTVTNWSGKKLFENY